MKKVAFVVNPGASPHPDRLKRRCQEQAALHGWVPSFMSPGVGGEKAVLDRDLALFASEADDLDEQRLVFAVGGDGTVKACAHALAGSQASMAVVPRGAANLFARALRLPPGLAEALAVGFTGHDFEVDLASADGETFTSMAGIGIDAAVVGSTPRLFKDHLGWVGYALAAVPQLAQRPREMLVRLDGGEPMAIAAQSVVVANVGIMPGGFGLFPGARMDDGLLDVGVLSPKSVLGWALMARSVVAKGHFADRYFAHFRAQEVEVAAAEVLARQVDGDAIAPGRNFIFSVRPQALRARVPRSWAGPHQ